MLLGWLYLFVVVHDEFLDVVKHNWATVGTFLWLLQNLAAKDGKIMCQSLLEVNNPPSYLSNVSVDQTIDSERWLHISAKHTHVFKVLCRHLIVHLHKHFEYWHYILCKDLENLCTITCTYESIWRILVLWLSSMYMMVRLKCFVFLHHRIKHAHPKCILGEIILHYRPT